MSLRQRVVDRPLIYLGAYIPLIQIGMDRSVICVGASV